MFLWLVSPVVWFRGLPCCFKHAVDCLVSLAFVRLCGNVARAESGTGRAVRVFRMLSVLTQCSVHSSAHSARSEISHARYVLRSSLTKKRRRVQGTGDAGNVRTDGTTR